VQRKKEMKKKFGRAYIPDDKWLLVMALLQEILNPSDTRTLQFDIVIIAKVSDIELIEKAFGGPSDVKSSV